MGFGSVKFWLNSLILNFLFSGWCLRVDPEMATAQLTASSISTRNLASFQGLRPLEAVKFGASVGHLRVGAGLSQRSFNGLVVKAATVVTPKVVYLTHPFLLLVDLCYFCLVMRVFCIGWLIQRLLLCGMWGLLVVNNALVCGWFGFPGIGFLIISRMGIGLKYVIEGLKLMQCDLLRFCLIK